MKSRSYQTKEGENRTVIELEADEIGPSLRYATAKVNRTQRGGGGGAGATAAVRAAVRAAVPPGRRSQGGQGGGGWSAPGQGGEGGGQQGGGYADPWATGPPPAATPAPTTSRLRGPRPRDPTGPA